METIGKLFHEVNRVVLGKKGWDVRFRLSKEAWVCLNYWHRELRRVSFEAPIDKATNTSIVFSNASATGRAAFLYAKYVNTVGLERDIKLLELNGPGDWSHMAKDMSLMTWSAQEQALSSTWREARTIQAGLTAFRDRLANSAVLR